MSKNQIIKMTMIQIGMPDGRKWVLVSKLVGNIMCGKNKVEHCFRSGVHLCFNPDAISTI